MIVSIVHGWTKEYFFVLSLAYMNFSRILESVNDEIYKFITLYNNNVKNLQMQFIKER